MSQISVHNDSSFATIHSSSANVVSEAVKHLTAVLRLLRPQDQLRMMVRLESLLSWDDHIRYLAVVSTKVLSASHLEPQPFAGESTIRPHDEFCILGIDVPISPSNPFLHPTSSTISPPSTSNSAPGSPQKAQRSHSSVSPDQHQGIGSRIASRTRKFLTLPKQKNGKSSQSPAQSPSPRLTKRPSISSSTVIKLEDLRKTDGDEENLVKICVGLALPITADMKISLDGDGGFRIDNRLHHHIFKPVSVQAMWSVLQTLLKASEIAKHFFHISPTPGTQRTLHASSSSHSLATSITTGAGSTTSLAYTESSSVVTASSTTVTTRDGEETVEMGGSHVWVESYRRLIDSMWVKEWHLILDDVLSMAAEGGHGSPGGESKTRRPLSPHMSRHRQQVYTPTESKIRQHLREVMLTLDLEQVNSKEIRQRVEDKLKLDLTSYKSFIDHEILVILGQMDSASEIFDHLYLGTEWNAGNLEELRKKGITLVLNVTTEINNFFPNLFDYKNIRVNDTEEEDMLHHWDEAARCIAEARKEGKKVLVHCKMGVSRSASVVVAYAMKANDWDLEKAMQFVKERRSCVQPNPGFMKQLEVYQGILEANKHRSSWQSATTGSTLSLNETTKSPKFLPSELDDLQASNLRRASSEFFSAPNLAPSIPKRSESLRLSSRPATFYFENEPDRDKSVKKSKDKKERKAVQWEAIQENVSKEEPEDAFGMLRVVLESPKTEVPSQTSERPVGKLKKATSLFESTSVSSTRSLAGQFCLIRQAANEFASTTVPKVKSRQWRQSASSVFNSAPFEAPVKESKYYGSGTSSSRRPSSIHVSSYLKPKDPVQTLVKYFDELTHSPHAGSSALQAAQV